MEKINVAKLLKDCPRGMELDCILWDNVTFERVAHNGIWINCLNDKNYKYEIYLDNEGCLPVSSLGLTTKKCIIFPKGKTTWEEFTPPCQFKDGDIIYNPFIQAFAIFCKQTDKVTVSHCFLNGFKELKIWHYHSKFLSDWRLATEEEKNILFEAIKNNGYCWNKESKTLETLPTFNDGDILTNKNGNIFIYKGPMFYNKLLTDFYCGYRIFDEKFIPKLPNDKHFGDISECRLATKEEKEKLFQAIKDNGYRWNEETKNLEKLIEPRFTVGDTIKSEKWQATRTIQTYVAGVGYFTTINDWVKLDEQDEWELVKDTTPIFKIGDKIKKKVRMIRTVDDLIKVLEDCKKRYPEFGKYIICVNASLPDDIIPTLKEPMLYINTDIGQVEIYTEDDEE